MNNDEYRYNGMTADEWETLDSQSSASDEDLQNLGILERPQQTQSNTQQSNNKLYKQADKLGIEHPEEDKQYQKLNVAGTIKDAAISLGVEASHIFAPKSKELQYESKTRIGETLKYGYRYLVGTASLFVGGGLVGGGIKAVGVANKATKTVKLGSGIQKLFAGTDIIKIGTNASKASKIGAGIFNASLGGAISGAIADFNLYRPEDEEGHLADLFGKKEYLNWLQSDDNDSETTAKFKNVLEGFIVGIGVGNLIEFGAKPLFGKFLKNIKTAIKADTKEEAQAALQNVALDEIKIDKFANAADMYDAVKGLKAEADTTGEEASQLIIDRMNVKDTEEAQKMLEVMNKGDDIFIHDDGTWDISVNKWDDAYKVSEEEYNKQLKARDTAKAGDMFNTEPIYAGDTALEYQNDAVKSTWTNRGWIGENEELTAKTANKISKNYKDKWQINNSIKVEFIDGLTINGKAVEGNTTATKFLGKNKKLTKAAQTKIDKKLLEINQLHDKITMLEGGNAEVSDPLDILKEKLRIAQNELKDLENVPQPKKEADITIKIDKNASNPYATLRAELEHARDISKGEVPNQKVQHFSRYNGMNEGEVASGYTYKKSMGKAKKTAAKTLISNLEVKEKPEEVIKPVKNKINPEQLKFDFNAQVETKQTPEEIVDSTIKGELTPKNLDDTQALIDKTVALDPEISGWKFKDIAEDSEQFTKKVNDIIENSEDVLALKEAFVNGDKEILEQLVRKQMAASKIQSILADKIENIGLDADVKTKRIIIDTVKYLSDYVLALNSGSGGMLNAQKLVNRALNTFGSMRLSQLTKEGIKEFADLLDKDVKEFFNLQFTKGEQLNLTQAKQQLFAKISQYGDGDFLELLSNDPDFALGFNDVLDNMLKKQGKTDINEIYQQIEDVITARLYKDCFDAVKLAPTKEGKIKTIVNWVNSQGGITSYYVHNLLSGLGSVAKNIGSGLMNTAYFPAKKILGGFLGGGDIMSKEGWNTYKSMRANWNESWQLCKQAFIEGEGKLTNVGADTLNMDDEVFKGFHALDDKNLWHKIQNIHSIMTRAMGATDEFMSQLNYRSICRAKCINQADKLAELAGKSGDEQWINETADKLFKTKFDIEGKPLDVDAYNEAKTILYQNNLNGKMFDNKTGNNIQMREQTVTMKLAQGIQTEANKNSFVKFIFPFVKTGANILQMNLDHNGLYAALSPAQRKLLMAQTPEGALARSQVAFGTFSLAMGTMMAANGYITGSAPPDPKERKALFETGWKPYSFRFSDTYVSYQGYEPLHTMMGFAADCFNLGQAITKPEDEQNWTKFSQHVGATLINNFMDKASFRTGLKQIAILTDPDSVVDWQKAMVQTMQGFLPDVSMIKNISSLGKREATQPKSSYEMLFNNYFNRGLGDYRRDVFGDRQDVYGLLVTTAGIQGNEPEYQELARLAEYGYNPSEISTIISDTKLKFIDFKDPQTGRSAYDTMQEELSKVTIGGKTIKEAIRSLVTSPEYQIMPDGIDNEIKWTSQDITKVNALNDLFRDYNDIAKENVINDNPQFTNSKGMTMQEAKEELEVKKMDKILNQQLEDTAGKIRNLF